MKWRTIPPPLPPWEHQDWMPMENEIRTRTVFAWWPIKCDDKMTRWLERLTITEKFGKVEYGFRGCYNWNWEMISAQPEGK